MAFAFNEALTSADDKDHLFPVRFAYDYIGNGAQYLKTPFLNLNSHMKSLKFLQMDDEKSHNQSQNANLRNTNAIEIFPLEAGFSLPTALQSFWQSKHWKAAVKMTTDMLEEFANDKSAGQTFKSNGMSFASIAKGELATVEDTWMKFTLYLFPNADEQRTRLLAAAMVYIFVFDDSWEMHNEIAIRSIQNDFIPRLLPKNDHQNPPKSSLQSFIDSTIQGFHDQDRIAGNGGQEVIDRMVEFFSRGPPAKEFQDMEQFLEYRRDDAAVPYVLACAKFSIKSSVDINSPKLERFVRLVSDHVSVANDLGSWRKEKSSYDRKKVLYLINAVDVVGRLMSLSEDAAIAITYALQLELERQIDAELENLMLAGRLDEEEWQFIDAVLLVLSGNVLVSSIMSRYGGETTRL